MKKRPSIDSWSSIPYTDQAGRSIFVSDVVPKAGLGIRRLRNLHQRQKARFGRMVRGCAHHRAPAALYRTVPAERLQALASLKCGFSIQKEAAQGTAQVQYEGSINAASDVIIDCSAPTVNPPVDVSLHQISACGTIQVQGNQAPFRYRFNFGKKRETASPRRLSFVMPPCSLLADL